MDPKLSSSWSYSETFDFSEAVNRLKHGHKITKVEWGDRDYYGVLRDGILQLHKPDGFHSWIISEADMMGEDWAVIP